MAIGRKIGSPIGGVESSAGAPQLVGTATMVAAGGAAVRSEPAIAATAALSAAGGAALRAEAALAGTATFAAAGDPLFRANVNLVADSALVAAGVQSWARAKTRVLHSRHSQQRPRSVTSISKFA